MTDYDKDQFEGKDPDGKEIPEGATKLNQIIIQAGADKLARDIKEIPIDPQAGICDYFIIMTGRNINHSRSIADGLTDKLAQVGFDDYDEEGMREGSWILLDCGATIVHIFTADRRSYYDLEGLWS